MKKCKHGDAERSEKNGRCLICVRDGNRRRPAWKDLTDKQRAAITASNKKWQENNRGMVNAKAKRYAARHPDRISARNKANYAKDPQSRRDAAKKYRLENLDQVKEYMAIWNANNKAWRAQYRKDNADKINAQSRARHAANPAIKQAYWGARRAAELQRTPKWACQERIKRKYQLAAGLTEIFGEPYEVDHIIPLQGKLVSGLHVHTNLQILKRSENREKSNKYMVI